MCISMKWGVSNGANLKPLVASNFSAARIRPMMPSCMRSARCAVEMLCFVTCAMLPDKIHIRHRRGLKHHVKLTNKTTSRATRHSTKLQTPTRPIHVDMTRTYMRQCSLHQAQIRGHQDCSRLETFINLPLNVFRSEHVA